MAIIRWRGGDVNGLTWTIFNPSINQSIKTRYGEKQSVFPMHLIRECLLENAQMRDAMLAAYAT